MEQLLTLAAPLVVYGLTAAVKRLPVVPAEGYRRVVLRFVAALFSFSAAITAGTLSGEVVDVSVFADALVTFLGASGVYFLRGK